jgi:hypothetical protein
MTTTAVQSACEILCQKVGNNCRMVARLSNIPACKYMTSTSTWCNDYQKQELCTRLFTLLLTSISPIKEGDSHICPLME